MKTAFAISLLVFASFASGFAAQDPVKGKTIGELNVIPQRVLQRSVSPQFYKSLLVSPLEGWVTVRANLAGNTLAGARVMRTDLGGVYNTLALQLAKEAKIAGSYSLDRQNAADSVLMHVLVYDIADGTMVLSFAHLDGPGGDQADYYGCARLLVLKGDKWTEIKGPQSLHGKGLAIRQSGQKGQDALRTERITSGGAESVNYGGSPDQ